MPHPDYEDDLAFEPRKTGSLTDEWREGKLEEGFTTSDIRTGVCAWGGLRVVIEQ